MKKPVTVYLCLLLVLFAWNTPLQAADDRDVRAAVSSLIEGGFKERAGAIDNLVKLGDGRAVTALGKLAEGKLYYRKADKKVFVVVKSGSNLTLFDPISGVPEGEAHKRNFKKIKVNNKLRRKIRAALGGMTLLNEDPEVRRKAAEAVFKSGDPSTLPVLEKAIAAEQNAAVQELMRQAKAVAILNGEASTNDKRAAIDVLVERGDRDALSLLKKLSAAEPGDIAPDLDAAIDRIERALVFWDGMQNVWYGLSLGSVLLLAAIGLAITFGVMGVINMAHGEMVMLGAYTTYVVQQGFLAYAPGGIGLSLIAAVPAAFLVTGAVGVAIERGIIRFLYGRPLETLLATWGLSLILQQAIRTIFGPTNREVTTPEWMSGSIELFGSLTLTSNRIAIIVFSAVAFVMLMILIRYSDFGLRMRAVTQNRAMANAVGIRSGWIDAMTFGLGSGIAGIAGVALSQIDNVSPNLGQAYIIDSFLVVVFGGVGNLWGTLVGAMSLGIANKFLEPYAGAVLGKILILVLVIMFIQKRPRGLFALKGRAVEA
jgi:urea transport system permease protein